MDRGPWSRVNADWAGNANSSEDASFTQDVDWPEEKRWSRRQLSLPLSGILTLY